MLCSQEKEWVGSLIILSQKRNQLSVCPAAKYPQQCIFPSGSISLICRNKCGNRTEPGGTPALSVINLEPQPSKTTKISRSCRKPVFRFHNWAAKPYTESLEKRALCHTRSNALTTSRPNSQTCHVCQQPHTRDAISTLQLQVLT